MDGRMDNRCRLADFEMGGRLVAIQFMRASVVKDVYTARYLYLCRLLSYPLCQSQELYSRSSRKTKQGVWIEPKRANAVVI